MNQKIMDTIREMMGFYKPEDIASTVGIPVEYVKTTITYLKEKAQKPVAANKKEYYCPNCDALVKKNQNCKRCKDKIDWSK